MNELLVTTIGGGLMLLILYDSDADKTAEVLTGSRKSVKRATEWIKRTGTLIGDHDHVSKNLANCLYNNCLIFSMQYPSNLASALWKYKDSVFAYELGMPIYIYTWD